MTQDSAHAKVLGRDRRRITAWGLMPLFILLVPLIAMQVTDEVQWDAADFILAGILLGAAGITYALLTPKRRTAMFRVVGGLVILTVLVLVWVQLAVGLFP